MNMRSVILIDYMGRHLKMSLEDKYDPGEYIHESSQERTSDTNKPFYKKFIYIDNLGAISIYNEHGKLVMTITA